MKLNNPSLIPVSLVLAIAIFVPTITLITSNAQGQEQKRLNATILFDSTNLGDKAYEPNPIEILAGVNVVWTNDDRVSHSVTAINGEFDTGIMQASDIFEHTFDKVEFYDYYRMLHPSMVGRVFVQQ
jgi:plastocyanin